MTAGLWKSCVSSLTTGKACVKVSGEEDMATLAFMIFAPNGCSIVYGLMDKGAVLVKAGPKSRNTATMLVRKLIAKG